MEVEVTTMACGSSSNKLDSGVHCVTCGVDTLCVATMWGCEVCQDYFLCESCYKGSLNNSELPSTPPGVHCQDHAMSTLYQCNGCGSRPIWNLRWHCMVCRSFDLCQACYEGLDAVDMPLEHLKEHPMIAIEVICSETLLKVQSSFSKPMDPQWSYKVMDTSSYGFYWGKKKPMSRALSGMDVISTTSKVADDNGLSSSKLKDQINFNFRNDEASQANGIHEKKHKVFLSHAGAEKDFVEQLHRDLLRVHHFGIFFDKDDESLPKGEPFPKRIFDAAKHCEFVVVVISHEYFVRKWPMLELATFVEAQKRRPELKILPIFYKLTIEEFKKQQKWFEKNWMKMGLVSKDVMNEWKEALKVISRTNGLEYDKRMGEVGLRDRIVEAVYKQVNPEVMWDDSHVQGKSQMQGIIQEMIQVSRNETGEVLLESTLRMGLFGMGGSGKTTMCKVLRNQMMSHYLGKVCHIEFGGVDVFQTRMKLLQGICQLESSFVQSIDEGQALTLLKTHIPKQRICLIIDNVSDNPSSIEEARTLLNLPFKEGSLIVVTSRSSIVLEKLKIGSELRMRMPSLRREDAKALFSHHAGCDTPSLTEEQMKTMESFVERCNFVVEGMGSKEYHPLALKVLGCQVGANAGKWQSIGIDFKFYEDEDKHPIFSILRSSFDTLSAKSQSIFLDIALVASDFNHAISMKGLQLQLRYLYGESDEQAGYKVVEVFQAKSLIEHYESQFIIVHDLYREFARMEMEKKGLQHSGMCCLSRGSMHDHVLQEGRVRIHDHHISHITKDILSCRVCSEAKLLSVKDCASLVSVNVPGMKNLKMFYVIGRCPQLTSVNLEGALNLRYFHWSDFEGKFYPDLTSLESLGGLWLHDGEAKSPPTPHGCLDFSKNSNLEVLKLSYLPLNLLNLNQAMLLKVLILENCQHLERFEGLEALAKLDSLALGNCTSLVEFPSLANFPLLKDFSLLEARKLKVIHGFAYLTTLSTLSLCGGRQLEELHGIEACTRLTWLHLGDTNIKDCSWISTMMDITFIGLGGTKISYVPDCNNLCKLSGLLLGNCKAMESIGNKTGSIPPSFPQSLRIFIVKNCGSLDAIPHFHDGSALESLDLARTCVEHVYGLTYCKQLERLYCAETRITSLPDLSSLTRLKVLDVSGCRFLTRMDNIKSLPALERLSVFGCTKLLALPDLRSSIGLMELNLFGCPLVDPNVVKLSSEATIGMNMEVVYNDNEPDNNIDGKEHEDTTTHVANFQAHEHSHEPEELQKSLTWWQWVGSWWRLERKDGKRRLIS